jgi:shikimate kinase
MNDHGEISKLIQELMDLTEQLTAANAELTEMTNKRTDLYRTLNDFTILVLEPKGRDVTEIRSRIQGLQARLLNMFIRSRLSMQPPTVN